MSTRWFGALLLAMMAIDLRASLTPGTPLPVRILYDNSGSMYPGYRPPGTAERRTRQELGVRYFHESPAFAEWLGDFVQRQTLVDGGTAGMWTFTSHQQFTPADIRQVHDPVPLHAFDPSAALRNFPETVGSSTYLTEALQTFTRDFTGIVWLITDNIVETNAGEPDAGVQRFFRTLAEDSNLRAVHLFKYAIDENGQSGALAVYGILVSPTEIPASALTQYDAKFRRLREAKRRQDGSDLFTGREYLKLKDLRVSVIDPELRLVLDDGDKGTFREGQNVELRVQGQIRSLLTQHTVTGGRYELALASPFVPDSSAQRSLGAQPFAPGSFEPISGELGREIPPGASRDIAERLRSSQPMSFKPSGLAEWLRLAWSGATVRYTGTVRMSFDDIRVRLEPQRMAGIFGIDHVSSTFDFQNIRSLPRVAPCDVPVSFTLKAGSSRSVLLLIVLGVLAAIATASAFVLSRKQTFRIAISNGPETIAALRRLASHDVIVDGKPLGRLWRGLTSGYGFQPVTGNPELLIVPAADANAWDVKTKGGLTRRLTIKADGGGSAKPQKTQATATRAAPPPPPAATRSAPPPPPRVNRR